ncbi:MAG: hypothetical protein PF485_11550 [Bacteroidales bacterium]|jgi:uncharacterized damage-inducible protein DinB|nr:hypothetical protein [Bacteroidales bacterium]
MKTIAQENLEQLRDLLLVISKENYNKKPDVLSGASIGQHIRHILEFYLLLISGSFEGRICYDKRERNLELETNPKIALEAINKIIKGIYLIEENEPLQVEGDFTSSGEQENIIKSSVARELAYCIEHSIHHQALIKAGLIALELKDLTNEHFGVAYSTIRYRNNSCAQ